MGAWWRSACGEMSKDYKEPNTYLFMRKKTQRRLGCVLLICGAALMISTVAGELYRGQPISIAQLDFISIYIGAILLYIGYKGARAEW